jgi:hypothetical protein
VIDATSSLTPTNVTKKPIEARNNRLRGRSGIRWWITSPSFVKCSTRRISAVDPLTKINRIHDPEICIRKHYHGSCRRLAKLFIRVP